MRGQLFFLEIFATLAFKWQPVLAFSRRARVCVGCRRVYSAVHQIALCVSSMK